MLRTPRETYTQSTSVMSDITALEAALREDPRDSTLWTLLAQLYQSLGRQGDAATARALATKLARQVHPVFAALSASKAARDLDNGEREPTVVHAAVAEAIKAQTAFNNG